MIRLGALGDVVRTLPTVAGLRERFPTAELTWMVEAKAAGVRGLSKKGLAAALDRQGVSYKNTFGGGGAGAGKKAAGTGGRRRRRKQHRR